MNATDRVRRQHMLDEALEARSFAVNRTLQNLSNDRMLLLSLMKEIEIIGEAANQISDELREAAHPKSHGQR